MIMRLTCILLFMISVNVHAELTDDCTLETPFNATISDIFQLWPANSNISKILIIKTIDENLLEDWLEISVFNADRNSNNSMGSPGYPSEYIYAAWGGTSGAKPQPAWLRYPGETVAGSLNPAEYIRQVKHESGRTYYRFGNTSSAKCNGNKCVLGFHRQYIDLVMRGSFIESIKVTQSQLAHSNGQDIWEEKPYCIRNATLDHITEWRYND